MNLFFVVGAQKSGSTWVQGMLNSFPEVSCKGEGHFADRLAVPIINVVREYNKILDTVERTVYSGCGFYPPVASSDLVLRLRSWILDLMRHGVEEHVVAIGDKTPATSLHLQTMSVLFPEAKYIHVVRDGRDAAISNYYHRARVLQQEGKASLLGTLHDEFGGLLAKWAHYVDGVRRFEGRIPIHTVRYEDLISSPGEALLGCLRHVNALTDANCAAVDGVVLKNDFKVLSGGRSPGEVDQRSFFRRGKPKEWAELLGPEYAQVGDPKVSELLNFYGYS